MSDGNPLGTAFARSVHPSHGTAGRASIIRRTGIAASNPRDADSCGFHNTLVPRLPASQRTACTKVAMMSRTGKRARGRNTAMEHDDPHVLRAVYETRNDGRTSRASSARRTLPPLLAPLSGLRVEREKHRRTFEGYTATPTGVVAVTPACLSRQPACNVSPAAPTPPRREHRASPARFSSPLLVHHPTRLPRRPLTPPLRRGERRHPSRSYAISVHVCVCVCIPLLSRSRESRTCPDRGMLTILLSRYSGDRVHTRPRPRTPKSLTIFVGKMTKCVVN